MNKSIYSNEPSGSFVLKIGDKEFYISDIIFNNDKIEYTASSNSVLTEEDKCNIDSFFESIVSEMSS